MCVCVCVSVCVHVDVVNQVSPGWVVVSCQKWLTRESSYVQNSMLLVKLYAGKKKKTEAVEEFDVTITGRERERERVRMQRDTSRQRDCYFLP